MLYATLICGISKTELTTVMEPEVEAQGKALGVSYEECLEELRQYYDGYHFSEHSEDVFYDSTSVLLATGLLRKGDKPICIHALFHFFSTFLRKLLLVSKENRNFAATIETLITLGL